MSYLIRTKPQNTKNSFQYKILCNYYKNQHFETSYIHEALNNLKFFFDLQQHSSLAAVQLEF